MLESSNQDTYDTEQYRAADIQELSVPTAQLAESDRFNLSKEEAIDASLWDKPEAPEQPAIAAPSRHDQLRASMERLSPQESIADIGAIGQRMAHVRRMYMVE